MCCYWFLFVLGTFWNFIWISIHVCVCIYVYFYLEIVYSELLITDDKFLSLHVILSSLLSMGKTNVTPHIS